jgi:ribosomal silencing factor RsfS
MVDVVVHVFNQESRLYYDLDSLWGDAKRVEWKPVEVKQPA